MISHICGEISGTGDGVIIIDVGGIGYEVHVTRQSQTGLADRAGKIMLYTHLAVREDSFTLYGFLTQEEREMFRMLISVTRVGPQLALSILSQITISDFAGAVLNEDERVLIHISGIGPKSAKRLILELKDRMSERQGEVPIPASACIDPVSRDAALALVSLGFQPQESRNAVDAVIRTMEEPTVQAVIKSALRSLKEK